MKFHQKVKNWISDYHHMLRGQIVTILHKDPPAHYESYVVEGKVAVVVIPGIFGKWGMMKYLADKISLAGHPVYVVPKLGYNIFSIPNSAKILKSTLYHIFPSMDHLIPRMNLGAQSIKETIEKMNIKNVVFVAHSKGGLIGKYFLTHFNQDRKVLGMISIATPYSGSALAKLIKLEPYKELTNDSKIIKELQQHREINKNIVSIMPEYDDYVLAENGSFLEGAVNVRVPVHGHHRVLFSDEVCEVVVKSIEKLSKNN